MRIAELPLRSEQLPQFVVQQHPRQRLAVVALLVPLGFGKFGQHHLGCRPVAFLFHQRLGVGEAFLDLPAFALGVVLGLAFLGTAEPVESAVFAQVVQHPRPFGGAQQPVQPVPPQHPGGIGEARLLLEERQRFDQPVALEQSCEFRQPPGPAPQAPPQQASRASLQVQRFAFVGGFGFVECTHAQIDQAFIAHRGPAYRRDTDVQAQGPRPDVSLIAFHDDLPYTRTRCGYPG